MKKKEFIEKIKPLALLAYREFNILPSLTISQAICESGWGKSVPGNMLFGMKWTPKCGYDFQLLWTSEFVNGKYIRVKAKFRKYDSWEDSIKDHSRLLQKPRYKTVLEAKNYLEATDQIKKCGYATSPTYTKTLRKIIEQNSLQLIDEEAKKEIMNNKKPLRYLALSKEIIDDTVILLETIKKQLKQLKEYAYIVETNVDGLLDILDIEKYGGKTVRKNEEGN